MSVTALAKEDFEEGEIKNIDNQNYITADTYFQYRTNPDIQLNWRNISAIVYDPQTGLPCNCGDDPTREILQNLEELAFVDLNRERNTRWISQDGRAAMTVIQLGIQYYMFAQNAMRANIERLHDYAQQQQAERERLQQILKSKKQKRKQMLAIDQQLNEQAIQFEILINRMRPDLLNKFKQVPRQDVRFITKDVSQVARDLLTEKGIIQNKTVLLDQITGSRPLDIEPIVKPQPALSIDVVKDLVKMISDLSKKVDDIRNNPKPVQPAPQPQPIVETQKVQPVQTTIPDSDIKEKTIRKNSIKSEKTTLIKKTTFSEIDMVSDDYSEDFEYTMKSESQQADSSESQKKASFGKSGGKQQTSQYQQPNSISPLPTNQNISGEDLDVDQLLLEGKQQHQKIRATSLGRTRGRNDNHTPIKEEDIEDDFDDGDSNENSKSKHTGGTSQIVIEEANNNYDSNNSSSFYDQHLASSSRKKSHVSSSKKQSSYKSELDELDERLEQRSDIEEEQVDEYVDDEFQSESNTSEQDFAKVSISQSGRLPPLSAANPTATLGVNRSHSSLIDAKDPNRFSQKYNRGDSGQKSQFSNIKDNQQLNLADSGDNIVDFDLSESKYTSHQFVAAQGQQQETTPRNNQIQKPDPALMSMDSMDFGLSESNFSAVNFSHRKDQQRSSTEKQKATTYQNKQSKMVSPREEDEDYSDTFN